MSAEVPIPIPLGSPHLTSPPIFDLWEKPRKAKRLDKRGYDRRPVRCDVWLIDLNAAAVLRCMTDNLSDAGLRATAPIGYGLAVGQRYEVRIGPRLSGEGKLPRLAPSLGRATVVRSQIMIEDGRADRVAFALRFDAPQLLPV